MTNETKPLSKMTLEEVKAMCRKLRNCSECILNNKICGDKFFVYEWKLEELDND